MVKSTCGIGGEKAKFVKCSGDHPAYVRKTANGNPDSKTIQESSLSLKNGIL